jgi:hypothetical protein
MPSPPPPPESHANGEESIPSQDSTQRFKRIAKGLFRVSKQELGEKERHFASKPESSVKTIREKN